MVKTVSEDLGRKYGFLGLVILVVSVVRLLIRGFLSHVWHQTLDEFLVVEKAARNDTDDRVGWNGGQHAQNASDVPGNEHDNENLKRR